MNYDCCFQKDTNRFRCRTGAILIHLSQIQEQFDVIVSSLAIHYVEDFEGVVRNVYHLLKEKLDVNIANYGVEGEREFVWFVDNVKKYHRTFSTEICFISRILC